MGGVYSSSSEITSDCDKTSDSDIMSDFVFYTDDDDIKKEKKKYSYKTRSKTKLLKQPLERQLPKNPHLCDEITVNQNVIKLSSHRSDPQSRKRQEKTRSLKRQCARNKKYKY